MAPLVGPAQRLRAARPVPPGHSLAGPGAGGLYRQGAPHHRHATPRGGLCHHAPGNRDRHPDRGTPPSSAAGWRRREPPPAREGGASSPRSAASTWRSMRCSVSQKSSPRRPRPWRSAQTGGASPSSTSLGREQAAPCGRDGRRSGPTYKCMPRHAASVADTRWSLPATPTSTWMPPTTRPQSTSEPAGRPAVSGGPRQAARRT